MKNPKPTNPTISDVASLADVSRTTVSLVMKGNPDIPAETKERVVAAIAELGYRPNPGSSECTHPAIRRLRVCER